MVADDADRSEQEHVHLEKGNGDSTVRPRGRARPRSHTIAQMIMIAAQVACGLFVGYWTGIAPLLISPWWSPASLIAVAGLALAAAAASQRLRVFFLTAAISGGFITAYSVAIVVTLGSMD